MRKGPGYNSRDSPALMTARRNLGLPAWGPARTTLMVTRLRVRRLVAVCHPYLSQCVEENLGALHIDIITHIHAARTHRRDSACPHEFGINSLMMVSVCFVHVFASSAALLGVLVRKQRGPNPNSFWTHPSPSTPARVFGRSCLRQRMWIRTGLTSF